MIHQLARKYRNVEVSSDCLKSSTKPPTAETQTTPKDRDGDDSDDDCGGRNKPLPTTFSISFPTPNGLDIKITIPNSTSLQNTTITIECGTYKLEIITGGIIAVLLTILIVVGVFCCKIVQKYKRFKDNWQNRQLDPSKDLGTET